jgi:hypothetical protein
MAAENQSRAKTVALMALLTLGGGLVGGVAGSLLTLLVLESRELHTLQRPDEVVKVGETLSLRSESGRPIMHVSLSRQTLRVNDDERANLAMIKLEAMSPGLTTLTLVDDQGAVSKVRILVQP